MEQNELENCINCDEPATTYWTNPVSGTTVPKCEKHFEEAAQSYEDNRSLYADNINIDYYDAGEYATEDSY